MPWRRDADGKLGVRSQGGASINVTMNVTAQDAASFRVRKRRFPARSRARCRAAGAPCEAPNMPNGFPRNPLSARHLAQRPGGPERRTEIVTLGSGRERRNARWAHARRRYDAGYGVTTLDALHEVIAFFEERRGRLYGFRWRDRADWKSCAPSQKPVADRPADRHRRWIARRLSARQALWRRACALRAPDPQAGRRHGARRGRRRRRSPRAPISPSIQPAGS